MNDNLDTFSDAELNELFAVEVAGWHHQEERWPDAPYTRFTWRNEPGGAMMAHDLHFTTDANAVLPWLEKCHEVSNVFEAGRWFVGVEQAEPHATSFVSATAPTFARAAVIALLRAKRSSK